MENKLHQELQKALSEVAHASCAMPKADPFEHGVQVGVYRGLQAAIQRLEALIEDAAEKERIS